MENRFIIIIPYYNVREYITECVNSILNQSYSNYIAIFCDDMSSDGTSDLIPKNDKFIINISNKRTTALENIHNNLINSEFIKDDDIIVILDGDDFFLNQNVLLILNDIYSKINPLISYGQYVYPNYSIGHCRAYSKDEFENLRNLDWRASHLRTFRYKVYQEIEKQDNNYSCFKDSNGDFYKSTYDIAMFHPMLEIAGFENVYFNPIPLYYYRIHQYNDHNVNAPLQKSIEIEIRSKKKFNRIF